MNNYFLLSLLPLLAYMFIKLKKVFHMLQQNWYNDGNRYIKWIKNNPKKVFLSFDMVFILFILFKYISNNISIILFSSFYLICIYIFISNQKKEQIKKPLAMTARVKRLFATTMLMMCIIIFILYFNFNANYLFMYYLILGLIVYIAYIVGFISNVINKPIEKCVFLYYKNKAVSKLNSLNNLKVIGITGSYGKTSSKNILNDILNVKYDAFATPKNFNTTYGLIISINNYLDKFSSYFIAEMGAFKRGEIKELCDLVKPTYGILTTIGTAHLESFGSRENIQKGKFELIESLPSDGIGILNGDDEYQVNYKLQNKCKIVYIGIENKNADVVASNIKLSAKGTSFDCTFKDTNTTIRLETRLLGKANIYNILASVALGHELGIENEKLVLGVKKVHSIEHRLEMKKYGNINIIDDAYNSNPVGSKMAIEVLGMMPGKKIVVTPGMIELGEKQYEINKNFGVQISKVCDDVILIGKDQTKPIYDGLVESGYAENHIHVLNDVKLAFPLMQKLADKDTYVLLENDLPDIFNEK